MTPARLLVIMLVGECMAVSVGEQTVCTKEDAADVVFLVDGSWSIGSANFQHMRNFLSTLVDSFNVAPDQVRIGLAQYSNGPRSEFLLNTYKDKQDILTYIRNLPYKGGATRTGAGLEFILKTQFTKEAGSRAGDGVPQIAVVITDGQSQDDIGQRSDYMRCRGIVLYAIGIKDADIDELRKIGNKPHDQHVYIVSDFNYLQDITVNILPNLCSSILQIKNDETLKWHYCSASQLELHAFADIVFLVDSSIKQQQLVKQILVELANQVNVNLDTYRMGLAQFTDDTKEEFLLKQCESKVYTLQKIKSFRLKPGGSRRIGAALDYARTNFLTPEAGMRLYPGFRQYLVLLVSGRSDDSVYRQSQLLRDQGVTVITVGFDNADPREMQIIATEPSLSKTVENTDQILRDIKTIVKTSGELNVANECKQSTVSDIVFIVDQSIATENEEFQIVLNFLYNIVAGLDISSNKVRVGVVLYGDRPKAKIYLNTHGNKNNILYHIQKLPYVNTTTADTKKALLFVKDDVLTTKRGSRFMTGVPQVAVVITTGHSTSDVRSAAVELRRFGPGVKVFTVGVKEMNLKGLHHIASYPMPTFLFTVDILPNLVSIQKYVRTSICHVTVNPQSRKRPLYPGMPGVGIAGIPLSRTESLKTACKDVKADIIALVEGSAMISPPAFQNMTYFIKFLMDRFELGPDAVRMGLVQYGTEPKLEFQLSGDKHDMITKTDAMVGVGGGTETGKALRYVSQLFDPSMGGRPGVPHILVVISEGKAQDAAAVAAVADAAEMLKKQGVLIYAVGISNEENSEDTFILGRGVSNKRFLLEDFSELQAKSEQIGADICHF